MNFKLWIENQLVTLYHVTPTKNLSKIKKFGLIPGIGPRSSKVGEVPGIFLFSNINNMEDAVMNWLGDEFDEEESLSLLQVMVPDEDLFSNVGYEYETHKAIPPNMITILKRDI